MSKEVDALVAEHVMGWEPRMYPDGCRVHAPGVRGFDAGPWSPSTDWRAAGEVLEKMARDGWNLTLEYKSCDREYPLTAEAYWSRWVSGAPDGHHAVADTAPMAICIASLRAKGVEVPK